MAAKLTEHMPIYFKPSIVASDITNPMYLENLKFENMIQEYTNQFIVKTATFTLSRYEEQYGLPVNPAGITTEERRSRIKSRMRMNGPTTKEFLQNILNAWGNSEVEITELFDQYLVKIKFISNNGIPSNLGDVREAISEIIPAHLNVLYDFKYRTHGELKPYTHQQLSNYTHQQIRDREDIV